MDSIQNPWPEYKVMAHNQAEESENRIHSDEVARQFGFTGALVPGISVYAYLTRPFMENHGVEWLGGGHRVATRFLKPAYQGENLTVTGGSTDLEGNTAPEEMTQIFNKSGLMLADLKNINPGRVHRHRSQAGFKGVAAPEGYQRPPVSWEGLILEKPMYGLEWAPAKEDNLAWCDTVNDDLPLYGQGESPPIHPGFLQAMANLVFMNSFVLDAWIHTGTVTTFHKPLLTGKKLNIQAMPAEKWEKKGNQFVTLYITISEDSKPAVEMLHSAIFKLKSAA